MELFLLHVLVRRESQNTVRVVAETLGLVKSQELEESALVALQLQLLLHGVQGGVSLQWLNASVILPYESLKLGRSIGQLGGCLGQYFVRVRLVHIIRHSLASLVLLVSIHESSLEWVILLELVVSSGLVIAEHGGDGQVL